MSCSCTSGGGWAACESQDWDGVRMNEVDTISDGYDMSLIITEWE